MSIFVRIGEERRPYTPTLESWISDQLHRRRADGANTCVRVTVSGGSINVTLSTPGCTDLGGATRRANAREEQLFDLWEHCGLRAAGFQANQVMAFLRQIVSHV